MISTNLFIESTFDPNDPENTGVVVAEVNASDNELANATLLAAAPSLLAECEDQLENWRRFLSSEWNGNEAGIRSAIASLKAVIARATDVGSSPTNHE